MALRQIVLPNGQQAVAVGRYDAEQLARPIKLLNTAGVIHTDHKGDLYVAVKDTSRRVAEVVSAENKRLNKSH